MNADGDITEAPGANLLYVEGSQVFAVREQALPGISMQTVTELTGGAREGSLYPSSDPDELWLTGTPFCMLPVVSLDGRPIGQGTIGPLYQQTLAKWSEMVGVNIQRQIEDWDAVRAQ